MAQILIADDDEIIAELAANILMDDGHACGWVTDGRKLMDLIAWKRPDLILLDQEMPEKNGNQVLRELRTSEKYYDIPVIMFTAKSGKQDELQAIYAGAHDYVRKPFTPELLLWHVNKALQLRAERPRHVDLKTVMRQSSGQSADHDKDWRSIPRAV
ncbi:PleD family two-component system response regulator [Altererythrobacter sp. GH1-8]|uniref:response regulator n=1 Tax=Altererythrobacter sp. GH1-8 TaxID=3349333 RepID=UPI00374DF16F